jgi:dTDP-4-amino-4,6-dideoxygalactose transaminase
MIPALEAIEESGIYSNFGPVNTRLELALTEKVFAGTGSCVTVCNATIGLMLAISDAKVAGSARRYALMPSFTFAATAHAAIWAGLTPLLCDIDAQTWSASPAAEDELLNRYAGQIACIVPYASFGNCLDLERYTALARAHNVGVVVDAASSLGSLDEGGHAFGAGFAHAVVFSMHATKAYATAEGGVIHCGDIDRISRLRTMANFGFGDPRSATMAGLNGKLSEVGALVAEARLEGFEVIIDHRLRLVESYRALLPGLVFQVTSGSRQAHQFMPVVLPTGWADRRAAVMVGLERTGIGARTYFSPHLAQQPYFAANSVAGDLAVTDDLAARVMSLPLADDMTTDEVAYVCRALTEVMRKLE